MGLWGEGVVGEGERGKGGYLLPPHLRLRSPAPPRPLGLIIERKS